MTPAAALSLLFSAAMKANHPDTASQPPVPPAELKQARDVLRQLVAVSPIEIACVTCKGKGTVPAQIGRRVCGTCKGTGVSP